MKLDFVDFFTSLFGKKWNRKFSGSSSIDRNFIERSADKRDSLKIATQLSSGRLTGIHVPSEEREGKRSVTRLRELVMKNRKRIGNQLKSYLSTLGLIEGDDDKKMSKKWIKKILTYEYNKEAKYCVEYYTHEWLELDKKLEEIDKHLEIQVGLSAIKFWTRKKFKGCTKLKRHVNPTRMPIEKKESYGWLGNLNQSTQLLNGASRCVHIGDRESDIYELFCEAKKMETHFLVRTCVDRLAGEGNHTIADEMDEVRVKGLHRVEVKDKKGNLSETLLEIKCELLHA